MLQLLSSGFARLRKDRIFWISIVLIAGFILFVLVYNHMETGYNYSSDVYFFGPFYLIGLFTACFTSIFLGTEHSDGAIRNKLIVGQSRTKVYLSNFIMSFAATILVCTVTTLIISAVDIPLYGALQLPFSQILTLLWVGILSLASYAAIFTYFSMRIPNKAFSAVICILGFLLIQTVSLLISDRLKVGEFTSSGMPNPRYLGGMTRKICAVLMDLLPTGLCYQVITHEVAHPLRATICTLVMITMITCWGILCFKRQDVK